MQYFDKLKDATLKAAQQGISLWSATNTPNETPMKTPSKSHLRPEDELVVYFDEICEIIDHVAESENPYSLENEKLLLSSKVRDHLQMIISLLQNESDHWHIQYSASPDPEISELPCLNKFLEIHVLHTLCNRASRDIPRGILPLVLNAIAILLKSVRYPLLPHQTVQKPIAHLISIAWRYEQYHEDILKSSNMTKHELMSYKSRIETGLVAVLSAIWRKISENPPLLDQFILVDHRITDESLQKPQIDILSAVHSLLSTPKIEVYSKEALLIAINMCDSRIQSFILHHTTLLSDAVVDIQRKYSLYIEILTINPPTITSINDHFPPFLQPENKVAATSRRQSLHGEIASLSSPVNSPGATSNPRQKPEVKVSTLDAFVNSLRFIETIFEICQDNSRSNSSYAALFRPDGSTSSTQSSPVHTRNRSSSYSAVELNPVMSKTLQTLFVTYFLKSAFDSAINTVHEVQICSNQMALLTLLSSLHRLTSTSTRQSQLLTSCLDYIIDFPDNKIVLGILSRCKSISKVILISAIKLLVGILVTCNPQQAKRLLLCGKQSTESPEVNHIDFDVVMNTLISKLQNSVDYYKSNLPVNYDSSVVIEKTLLERVNSAMNVNDSSPINSSKVGEGFMMRTSDFESHPIVSMLMEKLKNFTSINCIEEQFVVYQLVRELLLVIASDVLLHPHHFKQLAYLIVKIIKELEEIYSSLKSHASQIPQYEIKIAIIMSVLQNSSNVSSVAITNSNKLLEAEQSNKRRILETTAIVRLFYSTITTTLVSTTRLRRVFTTSYPFLSVNNKSTNGNITTTAVNVIQQQSYLTCDSFEDEEDLSLIESSSSFRLQKDSDKANNDSSSISGSYLENDLFNDILCLESDLESIIDKF